MPVFNLPSMNGIEQLVSNAGLQSFTVSGHQDGSILVEHWNGSAWATIATVTPALADRGLIGTNPVTVNASKRVRCTLSGSTPPAHAKVFFQ
jgi:hypothetical protein